ncbi:Hypothetical protein A7982_03244 [Minicystis rosea]|nr:Hypothetical protein A7982_03244 [Minicystis rosea]
MFERTCIGVVLSLVCAASLAGCAKKSADGGAEAVASASASAEAAPAAAGSGAEMTPESTIVEESEQGTITWSVTPDGRVEAIVKDTEGKPITKDITGVVTWPGEAADDIEYVTLTPEGHIVAAGPALEADLTEIQYDLVIAGKTWSGALHVPRGGTRAIEADATAANAVNIPAGKKGPNGGTIQVIGGEPVELVADKTTGEVRVYVLGPDLQPIDPGERRMRLGYVAEETETLDLEREPGTLYYVGRVRADVDPVRVTLAVGVGVGAAAAVHVGIVGFSFGARLGCGVRAVAMPFMVERHWTPSVRVGVHVGVGFYAGVGVHAGVGVRGGGRVGVGVRERVEVRERVHVRADERVNVHGHVREDRGRHDHHDNGVRDHGAGHGRDHGGGHAAPPRGGHGGPAHGGGGRGKRR